MRLKQHVHLPNTSYPIPKTSKVPETRRPCILCARANVTDAYLRLRQSRGRAGVHPPAYVLNWYCNPVGEGGYAQSACIPFQDDGSAWLGVYGTIVLFVPTKLRLVQDKETRKWWVDQSAILQDFDSGAARPGSSMVFDDALRRFLIARPDIHDGRSLVAPWATEDVAEDATWRGERMAQLAAAYGMSAGSQIAFSLSNAEDLCAAVADTGDPSVTPRSAIEPPWLAVHMLAVVSAPSVKHRTRRKHVGNDGGASSISHLMSRVLLEGASSRSVNEAATRAAADPPALVTLAQIVARALMGGYATCMRRMPAAWRCVIGTISFERLMSIVLGMPADTPLIASAVLEHAAALQDGGSIKLAPLCGGEDHWRPRVDRARLVMETLRSGFDNQPAREQDLASILAQTADAMRRVYRRSPLRAAAAPAPAPRWVAVEHAILQRAPSRPDPALLERISGSASPVRCAMAGASARAAAACIAGKPADAPSDDVVALGVAVRTLQCARRLRVLRVCEADPAMPLRAVVVCLGCFAVKNFINKRDDEIRAASACGFRDMMPPNRLFNLQQPRCTATPACADAPLFTTRLVAASGLLLAEDQAIVVSRCCGLVCSASAVVPFADGSWRCVACM